MRDLLRRIALSAIACLLLPGSALAAQLRLTWSDNATNESGTRIERSSDPPGTYLEIATVGSNTTAYTDMGVTANQGYCYRVRAYNGAGNSGYSNVACGTPDTTPPVPSNGQPAGALAAGTTSTTLSLATNENATCKWDTASNTYDNLLYTFTTTGALTHSQTLTGLTNGTAYTHYVRCRDTAGNTNTSNFIISFSVNAPGGDTTPPTRSLPVPATGTVLAAGTTSTTLGLTTNENATCKWGTASNTYDNLPNTFATTALTHSHTLTGLTSGTAYTHYVRCRDTAGNTNTSDFTISFSVAQMYTLNVNKDGTGTVTSTAPASAVNCGPDCTYSGPSGTSITLTANPGPGFVFSGWSGGGCTGNGLCAVTLTANTTVTATFTAGDPGTPWRAIVTGTGSGGGPHVRVLDAVTGSSLAEFFAYAPAFTGGVRVAAGDVTGDGVPDLVTAPGPGGGPHVKVFDGAALLAGLVVEVHSFFAYNPAFTGGVFVAAADLNGDGRADVLTSPGGPGGPHVKVFDGAALQAGLVVEVHSFFAYNPAFTGGVFVAAADLNGDGHADIITGTGPGGGPHVRVLDGVSRASLAEVFAYPLAFTGGVRVAAGDVTGDGVPDLVTAPGPGGGPHVKVFDGAALLAGLVVEVHGFFAYDAGFTGGVFVAAADLNGDGHADIITSPGPGGDGPHVRVFDGATGAQLAGPLGDFFAYGPGFMGGVFVATFD